jgi:hypothetical protein
MKVRCYLPSNDSEPCRKSKRYGVTEFIMIALCLYDDILLLGGY